jgi:small ligand-binding sensory domain FIST
MHRFLYGHSSGRRALQLVDDCLAQLGKIPQKSNLGFAYATDELSGDLNKILDTLMHRTGIEHWSGTIGVGINTTGREYYDQPALAIMVATFPEHSFINIPVQKSGIESFMAQYRGWYQNDPVHFGILHADPANPSLPILMDRLVAEIPGVFFVGGLTSSDSVNLQIADGLGTGGVSGILFSGDVAIATGHTQGCSPIASRHIVTRCERNIIVELDNQPALDVFKQDIGEVLAKDMNRVAGYIFIGLPVFGSDTGDYMVRNLLGIDVKQKLIAVGDYLSEGNEILFCRRDGNTAREDMLRMLADLKQRITGAPKGAVYYSCLGRGRHQFGDDSEELKMIRDELGDIPLVGFFANGEIFHNRLYGYTGVLTLFC